MKRNYKIVVLFILIIFFTCIIPFTNSKYESTIVSNAKSSVAIYLLEATYDVTSINIPNLEPSLEPYVYYFRIANNDGENRTETSLQYDLSIRTTTNLPLEYKLYLDEDYKLDTSTDLFGTAELITDENGMYFQKLSIPTRYFGYTQNEIDSYTLVIYFPYEYRNHTYQDMVESIEIVVDSKQVITE